MSTFSCPVVVIKELKKHPNADTLSITEIDGEPCVVRTDAIRPGDLAVYFPVESMVPVDHKAFSFLKKNDKEKARIKAIRLRGVYSEGLLVSVNEFPELKEFFIGQDVSSLIGVTKYEESENNSKNSGIRKSGLPAKGPKAPKFNVEPLLKYYKHKFNTDDEIVVTEKIHGCNIRAVFLSDTEAKKQGLKAQLYVGSHNLWRKEIPAMPVALAALKAVPLAFRNFTNNRSFSQARDNFFSNFSKFTKTREDIWCKTIRSRNLEETLRESRDLVIYGEMFGEVQDLHYGHEDDTDIRVFAIYNLKTNTWLSFQKVIDWCKVNNVPIVPLLYKGKFDLETIRSVAYEPMSNIDGKTIREGAVVSKLNDEYVPYKIVSPTYKLRSGGTEFH